MLDAHLLYFPRIRIATSLGLTSDTVDHKVYSMSYGRPAALLTRELVTPFRQVMTPLIS